MWVRMGSSSMDAHWRRISVQIAWVKNVTPPLEVQWKGWGVPAWGEVVVVGVLVVVGVAVVVGVVEAVGEVLAT